MAKSVHTVYTEVSGTPIREHSPIRAWKLLQPNSREPERVEILKLKNEKKSCVYRLCGVGPDGSAVIAKRCREGMAHVERLIYEEVLPAIGRGPALHYYGFREDPDNNKYAWIFLEDAEGQPYSPLEEAHRALAGRWLAEMHLAKLPGYLRDRLANRQPAYYLKSLRYCQVMLQGHLAYNPALSSDMATVLKRIARRFEDLESQWGLLDKLCAAMPRTLVHGDFVIRNLRVRDSAPSRALLVFDWELAGWGVPATDLGQFEYRGPKPDLHVYLSILRRAHPHLRLKDIEGAAACGNVFRMIDQVRWTLPTLDFDSPDSLPKPVSMLHSFEDPLEEGLRAVKRCAHD